MNSKRAIWRRQKGTTAAVRMPFSLRFILLLSDFAGGRPSRKVTGMLSHRRRQDQRRYCCYYIHHGHHGHREHHVRLCQSLVHLVRHGLGARNGHRSRGRSFLLSWGGLSGHRSVSTKVDEQAVGNFEEMLYLSNKISVIVALLQRNDILPITFTGNFSLFGKGRQARVFSSFLGKILFKSERVVLFFGLSFTSGATVTISSRSGSGISTLGSGARSAPGISISSSGSTPGVGRSFCSGIIGRLILDLELGVTVIATP
jgi:hypothetical protein